MAKAAFAPLADHPNSTGWETTRSASAPCAPPILVAYAGSGNRNALRYAGSVGDGQSRGVICRGLRVELHRENATGARRKRARTPIGQPVDWRSFQRRGDA